MVGTCTELIRAVYIGGKSVQAAYIRGLKKDADYTGGVRFGANLSGLRNRTTSIFTAL